MFKTIGFKVSAAIFVVLLISFIVIVGGKIKCNHRKIK